MNQSFNPPLRKFLKPIAVLYLMLVLVLTHLPHPSHVPDLPGKDKTLHFIAYTLAAILVLLGYLRNVRFPPIAGFILGLLFMGILDEVTQPYFGRTCDLYDWLADLGGILTGSFLVYAGLYIKSLRATNRLRRRFSK